jgi:hypothetical protein
LRCDGGGFVLRAGSAASRPIGDGLSRRNAGYGLNGVAAASKQQIRSTTHLAMKLRNAPLRMTYFLKINHLHAT